jgi:hypothetical protein
MSSVSRVFRTSNMRLAAVVALVGFVGCGPAKPEPEIASSAGEATYAQQYPAAVDEQIGAFGKGQVELTTLQEGFKKVPDGFDGEVDYARVADALEQADRVGRSHAFVHSVAELESVRAFFDEEREPIAKKVAGAAQYVAKQAGCASDDVGSAAAGALDKSVQERIEERLRKGNDAQRIVERYGSSLGKKNTDKLERNVNDVARASNLAYIVLVQHKVRLHAMLGEADAVRQTLDSAIATERAYQSEAGRTDAEKQSSHARVEELKRSQGSLDGAAGKVRTTLQDIDDRMAKAQREYEKALSELLQAVRAKIKK